MDPPTPHEKLLAACYCGDPDKIRALAVDCDEASLFIRREILYHLVSGGAPTAINLAISVYSRCSITDRSVLPEALRRAARRGKEYMVKAFITRVSSADARRTMRSACKWGHRTTAAAIRIATPVRPDADMLEIAVNRGHCDTAIWIRVVSPEVGLNSRLLGSICRGGHVDLLGWLVGQGLTTADVRSDCGAAIRTAVENGHRAVAAALYEGFGLAAGSGDFLNSCLALLARSGGIARMKADRHPRFAEAADWVDEVFAENGICTAGVLGASL